MPGALIAFVRPTHRREIVFSLLAGAFMVLLFCESAVYAANSGDFKERYLFTAMPLLALAYGVYLKRGRPHPLCRGRPRRGHRRGRVAPADLRLRDLDHPYRLAVSLRRELARAAHELRIDRARDRAPRHRWPVHSRSGRRSRATAAGWRSEPRSSLRSPRRSVPSRSIFTTPAPRERSSRRTSPGSTPPPTGRSPPIATPYSSRVFLLLALYWNPSIAREVTLDHAVPTDSLAAPEPPDRPPGAAAQHDRRSSCSTGW